MTVTSKPLSKAGPNAGRWIGTALLGISVLGIGIIPAEASSASRLPCTYEARVAGCHVRPHKFYIFRTSPITHVHWSSWNHTSARGDGHIGGPHSTDGADLVLHRVRDHHFTRLTVITQGIFEHYHWSASEHSWES